MDRFIKTEINGISREQSDILIAELSEINFYAFEENPGSLSAFIKEHDLNEGDLNRILSAHNVSCKRSILENANWNEKWESEFEPVIVEDFVGVRASFHEPVTGVEHEIIITPKMSFGTGHHATTYLMLQLMRDVDFNDKAVLDFGTGTGILAIMAKKLGAKNVTAIDSDEWSVTNAKENMLANACDDIQLVKKDDFSDLGKFDVILCNIHMNFIRSNITQIKSIGIPGGKLLISGFLAPDAGILLKNFEDQDFIAGNIVVRDGWGSALLTIP